MMFRPLWRLLPAFFRRYGFAVTRKGGYILHGFQYTAEVPLFVMNADVFDMDNPALLFQSKLYLILFTGTESFHDFVDNRTDFPGMAVL